jgi:hypothetical protein
MLTLIYFVLAMLGLLFKSSGRLAAENVALRHQLMVLQRQLHGRVHLTNLDRSFLVQLYRWFPWILKAVVVVQPETLVRQGVQCDASTGEFAA